MPFRIYLGIPLLWYLKVHHENLKQVQADKFYVTHQITFLQNIWYSTRIIKSPTTP